MCPLFSPNLSSLSTFLLAAQMNVLQPSAATLLSLGAVERFFMTKSVMCKLCIYQKQEKSTLSGAAACAEEGREDILDKCIISLTSTCWLSSKQRTCGAPTSAKGIFWRKNPSPPLKLHIHHLVTIRTCSLTSPPPSQCWWASSSPQSQVQTFLTH